MKVLRLGAAALRLGAAVLLLAAGCGDEAITPAAAGRSAFSSRALSTSPLNAFACSTCHTVDAAAPAVVPGRFDSGYNLAGAAARDGWWGNGETRLLDAINVCLETFMGGRPLTPEEPTARQLVALLTTDVDAGRTKTLPFTVVRAVTGLEEQRGDATHGKVVYDAGCYRCHGAPHTGAGALTKRASLVPEDTLKVFPKQARAAVVEKVRHGRFFNLGGVMPLYSVEALSDRELVDLLAYLGL